ncbi:MAG: FAD-dependent monooxygenase, partial [Actinomycetota bacterium]
MEPGRAVVVGGSLGGLTVANLLRDAGWEVSVHERSPRPLDGRGAGIVVHEATVRYLLERRDLSLDDVSCPSSWIRHLAPDGSVEHEAPSTYRFTAWNTLYQALLEPMADRYHLGHEVAAVHPQSVELADGRTFDADLIVAADGFDSTVRRQFFPHIAPQYSGYVG